MGIVKRTADHARDALVSALYNPAAYPDAQQVEHLETHISHVFLTGRYAYKIKKPLDLGFLDFSSLDQRRRFCEEEVRINRRLAPELYLGVVPITGTAQAPAVEGLGEPLEYAVKMRQFAQEGLLDRLLEEGRLTPEVVDAIAAQVARFHADIERAPAGGELGTPTSVIAPAEQNFEQLAPLVAARAAAGTLAWLHEWTLRENRRLAPLFAQRLQDGFVRECHGDLHLANMVLIDGAVRIFDAIEFSPALRWIDVISEVAFLAMDLCARQRVDLAFRFINAYLEHTGDYAGSAVLRYYMTYRAVVRAKVAAMRAGQAGLQDTERRALADKCDAHLELARGFAQGARPTLIIHHGLSGSGKTTCSQTILEAIGAIRIRSDVERKRMHGLDHLARTGSAVGEGIYAREASLATYERLATLAGEVIQAGYPVLVDATFLKRAQRDRFRALAARLGVPLRIASFVAREDTLAARILARTAQGGDASEAGLEVLRAQLREGEPLTAEEAALAVTVDTETAGASELIRAAHALLDEHR